MNCCTIFWPVCVVFIAVAWYWVSYGGGGKEVKRNPSGTPRSQQQQAKASASRTDSRRIAEYLKQADEATDEAWQFMSATGGWKKEEASEGPQPSTVYSKESSKYGKMFMLVATIDINPELITRDMAVNAENMPKWNPAVLEVKIIDELDDTTTVLYNVMAPLSVPFFSDISSRDMVLLMRYVQRDGWFSTCLVSTAHDAAPVRSYTRGEQSPGCMRFRSTGDGRSRFEWLLNTNLKISLPQIVIDSYTPGGMTQYLEYLRKHCIKLKAAAASSST